MTLDAWLARSVVTRPQHAAVIADDGALTYADLDVRASAVADDLVSCGAGAGTRVGLVLAPSAAFAAAFWGVQRAGAVAVPVDPRLGAAEREVRVRSCVLVVDGTSSVRIGPDADAPPVEAAVIIHTSGTTQAPKPIALTGRNWWWSAAGSAVALGHRADERWLSALPVAHVGGLSILVRAAIAGTTAVLHERFDAARVAAALAEPQGPTMISVVPTMLTRLLDEGLCAPPALRAALVGGGPIPSALLDRAGEAGIHCVSTYGLTEACSQVTTGGPPLFCTRVRIEPSGEIAVRGPTVSATAADSDGWLRTGDLGRLDPDGTLHVIGRASDTIVTGGENVSPAEIEAILAAHPAVSEVGVRGRPDDEWGEAVVATVVLRVGVTASAADLRAHARAHLAGFKVPKAITFSDALPRTASGKLLRREL